ncbi:MAG: class I SAM-dependent methyltransferase [Candidatus Thorarchaeota archaeon]|nr:class I SAM-dependent methyltransferase [Candidatus Thorarchaeota archaeon]
MAKRIGGPILELACGTGRVLLKLAEQGYEIVGIDATSEMLDIANRKARELGDEITNRITLHQGDIANFDLKRKFPLIIIPSSFKFNLTTEKQLECLESVKRHLDDGGIFILDHYPSALKPVHDEWKQGPSKLSDGTKVSRTLTSHCDYSEQIQRFTAAYEIEFLNGVKDAFVTSNAQSLIFERER